MFHKKAIALILTMVVMSAVASCSGRTAYVSVAGSTEAPPVSAPIAAPSVVGSNSSQTVSGSADSTPTATETNSPTGIISRVEDIMLKDLPDKVFDPSDYYPGHVYLLAELKENDIFLYGYSEPGTFMPHVILRIHDSLHFYDWEYITPRSIPPVMTYSDFDGDGKAELAIVLYVGSGTGYAVEDLRMIEFGDGGSLTDYYLSPADYLAYLGSNIAYTIDNSDNLILTAQGSRLNAGKVQTEDRGKLMGLGGIGDNVHFYADDNKILGEFGIGLKYENWATMPPAGIAVIDISYNNGRFTMGDIVLKPYSN